MKLKTWFKILSWPCRLIVILLCFTLIKCLCPIDLQMLFGFWAGMIYLAVDHFIYHTIEQIKE